ncbi:fructosamine kinase family protein [Streptomyces sp. HNM0574]|uniref:fructosamine kinase family protein n=1 Tax=Streptomyces sp. HNM0574 TaxID=2714954 RepID=UPI0032175F6E
MRATGVRAVPGGDICAAYRVELTPEHGPADTVFAKTRTGAPADFFPAEAAGLARLAATGAVRVPAVLGVAPDVLVLEWAEAGPLTEAGAERLGRELAALHASPADGWGTPGGPCYLGPLPLDSPEPAEAGADWPAFHARHRLLPLLRAAVDQGGIGPGDARDVERLCARLRGGPADVAGPAQEPAVIHGDLWSGNLLPSAGTVLLIDPAAQGGHPETDLAMLELFGCPRLSRILAAYEEVRPLPGRAERVPLHQLQHLLVHAVLFGSGYGAQCGAAARAALAATG